MRRIYWASLLLLLFVLPACSQTEFRSFYGDSLRHGTGGTMIRAYEIDFWDNGTPPRRFEIIGVIDHERTRPDVDDVRQDVAIAAKKAGANAVILHFTDAPVDGMMITTVPIGNKGASVGMASSTRSKLFYRFWAVKYLP